MTLRGFIVASVAFLRLTTAACAAQSAGEADALARDGKYAEAVDAYEAILAEGRESAALYYNLGYSYFKQGMLGKSILNFERSKLLNPSDADVDVNLEQAYALTDKMQEVEPLLLARLWGSVCNLLSSDGWAVAFVVFFALALAGVGCFLLLDSVAARKFGFFSAILLLCAAVFSVSVSLRKRAQIEDGADAIIMVSSVNLTTSPDKNATQMAVLHEGTKVRIVDALGEWIEVRLKDGNVGWLRRAEVEKI